MINGFFLSSEGTTVHRSRHLFVRHEQQCFFFSPLVINHSFSVSLSIIGISLSRVNTPPLLLLKTSGFSFSRLLLIINFFHLIHTRKVVSTHDLLRGCCFVSNRSRCELVRLAWRLHMHWLPHSSGNIRRRLFNLSVTRREAGFIYLDQFIRHTTWHERKTEPPRMCSPSGSLIFESVLS